MKNDNVTEIRICPRCGKSYSGRPALSRADNKTLICPDCGTREALKSIGVKPDEQEQILETIHRSMLDEVKEPIINAYEIKTGMTKTDTNKTKADSLLERLNLMKSWRYHYDDSGIKRSP